MILQWLQLNTMEINKYRNNENNLLKMFSSSFKFSEHLIKYVDSVIYNMYDHNIFTYDENITLQELEKAYIYQKQDKKDYLKFFAYKKLNDELINKMGLEENELLTMAFNGNTNNWNTNKNIVIKDIDLDSLNYIELKHYKEDYGEEFILLRNKTFFERKNDSLKLIGAYLGNKIVGSMYVFDDGESSCIDGLIVDESYRHQKIATTMIKHVIDNSNNQVFLHADRDDTPKDMYTDMGFEIVDSGFEYFKKVVL